MNRTESFFVDLLRAFAVDGTPRLCTEGVDPDKLFALAKSQDLAGAVDYMLRRLGLFRDEDIADSFSFEYDRTVMQMLRRGLNAKNILDKLSENKIPHIIFKGFVVRECYPVAELRTFGDVDIIIRPQDTDRVVALLEKEGLSHKVADEGAVHEFDKEYGHYEVHTSLNLPFSNGGCLENPWEHCARLSGESFAFDHSFHLCYLISHIAKHMTGSGAGIRMYLDIALYIEKYREEISTEEVRDSLKEYSLDGFFCTVLYLCHRWFSLTLPAWVQPLSEESYEKLCSLTLGGGIFGENDAKSQIETALRGKLAEGKKGAKLRLIMSRIFPSKTELWRIYPKHRRKVAMIPFLWAKHIVSVIRNKKLKNIRVVTSADTKALETKSDFLKSVGCSLEK